MKLTSKTINTSKLLPPFEVQFNLDFIKNLKIQPEVLELKRVVGEGENLCILLGSSGAGRDTILETCLGLKRSFARIKRITTREVRDSADLNRMLFTDEKTFLKDFKEGKILFVGRYEANSRLYGIDKEELLKLKNKEKFYFIEATLVALPLKKLFPKARLVLILPPSIEILKKRLISRNNWQKRLEVSQKEIRAVEANIKEMSRAGWVDLVLPTKGSPQQIASKICAKTGISHFFHK